ncbi:MAG: FAD-binding oxidoreductase [Candidatus Rokubacteria bacterium]|nr:FAD-binding oxidoreductase [Candidatus Rokubacteria bacterium]
MSVSTRSIGDALTAIVGRHGWSDAERARAAAAVDGVLPRWVVGPGSLAEVARTVALAHEAGLAVVPRGSGSAQALGAPPARVDLVLDMRRVADVVEYNPDDLTITVQAGLTAGALAARLRARRQFLPLDPPGAAARTLGGLVATAGSGPLRARYGSVRDLLLGVRFVQADGVLTWGGARVVKSVSGYDIPKLMVGSLGTLGVLGELTLRLHPIPDFEATSLVTFSGPAAAAAFLGSLLDSTVQPSRVEFLNEGALAACEAPPALAAVAVSIATVEAAVRAQERLVDTFAREAGGRLVPIGASFWDAYGRRPAREPIGLRVATLASLLGATVETIERSVESTGRDARASIGGSGVFGTLDVGLDGVPLDAVGGLVARLRGVVAEAGGSVVIERAPREIRATIDPWGPVLGGPLGLMRKVKEEFDPKGILNPGRFVGGL